jgi:hypothetical protein
MILTYHFLSDRPLSVLEKIVEMKNSNEDIYSKDASVKNI